MGKCQLLFFRFVNYCRSDKRCLLGNLCFKFFRARAITIFTNPRFTIVSPLCNRVFDQGSLNKVDKNHERVDFVFPRRRAEICENILLTVREAIVDKQFGIKI